MQLASIYGSLRRLAKYGVQRLSTMRDKILQVRPSIKVSHPLVMIISGGLFLTLMASLCHRISRLCVRLRSISEELEIASIQLHDLRQHNDQLRTAEMMARQVAHTYLQAAARTARERVSRATSMYEHSQQCECVVCGPPHESLP
jgi:hypothetical protein